MERLNTKLLSQFTEETNLIPTYTKEGATYHTLSYVNWLESKIEHTKTTMCEDCETNISTVELCEPCYLNRLQHGA